MTSLRRNRPGTKAKNFFQWPSQSFEDMESTLSYQQFIQQNIRKDPHDIETILNLPESLDFNKDSGIWKYEHIRQFCIELNSLYILLQDICNSKECPQMSATSQCIYLCASHKAPKECPAIIYTRHTLDGSAALLNASKYFPSRVNFKESSLNKLESICRRIYRIFGHAFYHHRAVYDSFEASTSLCQRFTLFSLRYNMMAPDNIIVPIGSDHQDGVEESIPNGGGHFGGGCEEDVTMSEPQHELVDLEPGDGKPRTEGSAVSRELVSTPQSVMVTSNDSPLDQDHKLSPKQWRSNGGAIASLAYSSSSLGKKGSSPASKNLSGSCSKIANTNTIPKRNTTSLSPAPHPPKGVSSMVAKTRHSDTSIPSVAQLS